jgi:phosphoserine aminotransferase
MLIYAGAQKNMGPSGVTLVILRDDLLQRIPENLATMLDYGIHVENKSLYNTPNTWGIYIIDLVCKWLRKTAASRRWNAENDEKAQLLYDAIDATDFLSRSRRLRLPLEHERHISFAGGRAREEVCR